MYTLIKAHTLSQCMETVAKLVADNEKKGERNLVFCEDRLTLIAERNILRATGGTFLTSVSTFARFLRTSARVISKQGSVMAVGAVMTALQHENRLQCFRSTTGVGNDAKCIYETLAQFTASEITAELLKESAEKLPESPLKRKVQDIALILESYTDFLSAHAFLDESRYLSLLPYALRDDKTLKDTNVFFLCYTSFTAQAAQTIRAALGGAKHVYGIFCDGEESLYTGSATNTFLNVCKEFGQGETLCVGTPLDGDAERLRRGLFEAERIFASRAQTSAIRIFEAGDKTEETEYVAVQIRRALAQNPKRRYRDIAVLVSDVAQYSLPIKRAFGEYGIPYFIDEKKSLGRHPLAQFLLDCFRVAAESYAPAAVQSLTQNYFFGNADNYRNYLLKFANYRRGAKREIKTGKLVEDIFPNIEELQLARERLLLAVDGIKNEAYGSDYCRAVRKILVDFDAQERLKTLEESTSDVAQKGYLAQIEDTLLRVLDEAELLTKDRKMTVKEFAAVLKDGLDAAEISLIPLKLDAVFIGGIAESRIEKVSCLFALGMTEDVPVCANDTAIISDRDIQKLEEVQMRLEPTVAQVNSRSRESVALNLCTFIDELHLSYPLAADGSEPALSDVFRYVDTLFCTPQNTAIPREKDIPEREWEYVCSAPVPAVRKLLRLGGELERGNKDTCVWHSSIYTALDKLSVTEKYDYMPKAEQDDFISCGEELFLHDGKISPTALEGYFACPFRHFVERGLKLKPREETAVLAVDTGNFIHELLQETTVKAEVIPTEEEMYAFAVEKGKEILARPIYALQSDTASGEVFSDKLLQEGAQVALAAYRQIKRSAFKVEETEKGVDAEFFRGKVDRVDGTEKYVRIIDYKTGSIDDSATSYYTGRKLQMQLYMSSLQGERTPAGVFYFPASLGYAETDEGRFKMKGFLNGDKDAVLCGDTALTDGASSDLFPATLVERSTSKRMMDESTFRDFIDYSVHVARKGVSELKQGFVAPTPYDTACSYCKYGGMCGFNKENCTPRKENAIDTTAIAEIARKKREGGND